MLNRRFLFTALLPLIAATAGCGASESAGGGSGGAASGSGGAATGSGGSATGSGGAQTTGSGGAITGSGGARTGGAPATGGATTGSGGANGGATATGGRANTGGATAAGGAAPTGGRGGATATGGAGGGAVATGNEFWISPTGKDTNPGTKESPRFSLCDDDLKTGACYNVCPMGVGCIAGGATIWVMDGVYKYGAVVQKIGSTKLGTAAGMYKVFAVAGAKPVFDFTGQPIDTTSRGIQLQGDYWHIKGITVTKAGDTGIFVMGNNNTIEQCLTHHNEDAGLVIGVNPSRAGTGINNLILNCDSYQNYDTTTKGENADGFGLRKTQVPVMSFEVAAPGTMVTMGGIFMDGRPLLRSTIVGQ